LVVWSFQPAHPVVRRLRRPPRGHSCRGAFRSLSNPVHRLTRCVVSGVLAGSARPPPISRFRSFLSWNFSSFSQPLFRVSPGTSTPARRRFRSAFPRLGRSLRFGRKMPSSDSFRPRGFCHLDGLLRSRPPASFSWHQMWGSPGWSCVVRWCSADLSAGGPPRTVRGMPLCALPCEGFFLVGSRFRIAAACSPPAVHRVPRSLSRSGSASFRTDRSPWAARSAPSPSFTAFRLRSADGPGDFPLGRARCLASPGCPVARGRTRSMRVESLLSAPLSVRSCRRCGPPLLFPSRGRVAGRIAPAAAFWSEALGLPLPPRGGRVAGVTAVLDCSGTARPPFSGAGSLRFLQPRDGALVVSMVLRVAGGPLVPLPRPSLPHRP